MTAGKGINHSEMFPLLNSADTNRLELFQIWINLPRAKKMVEPSYKMLWAEQLPQIRGNGVELDLIAGALPGMGTPPAPPPHSYATQPQADVLVATVTISHGKAWTMPAATTDPT